MGETLRTRRARSRGVVSFWLVLVLFLVFMLFLALPLEVGYMVLVGNQLQVAADAAALAAVSWVRSDDDFARTQAVNLAAANTAAGDPVLMDRNDANDEDGDVVLGRFSRDTGIFTPDASQFNAVKTVARRTEGSLSGPLPLLFGGLLGEEVNLTRIAIAMVGGGTGAGLIVLNETDRYALALSGNVTLHVNGGAIQVNSANAAAAYFGGSITLDGAAINVVGGYRSVGGPILPSEINIGAPPIANPLANLPPVVYDPSLDLGAVVSTGGETLTIGPGYYSGGISINNGTLNLLPGIYILDTVLSVSGSANFIANGVMFYLVGSCRVQIGGGGNVVISPPDPDLYSYDGVVTYEGIAIFQAVDNTSEGTIIGTALMDLQGSYYFPSNHMNLGGNASRFGNQFIVNTLEVSGNGDLTIVYDGRFPAPGGDVFLVY